VEDYLKVGIAFVPVRVIERIREKGSGRGE